MSSGYYLEVINYTGMDVRLERVSHQAIMIYPAMIDDEPTEILIDQQDLFDNALIFNATGYYAIVNPRKLVYTTEMGDNALDTNYAAIVLGISGSDLVAADGTVVALQSSDTNNIVLLKSKPTMGDSISDKVSQIAGKVCDLIGSFTPDKPSMPPVVNKTLDKVEDVLDLVFLYRHHKEIIIILLILLFIVFMVIIAAVVKSNG